MSRPVLFFDAECPVCRSFAKLLTKNLADRVELRAMEKTQAQTATDFQLELSDGRILEGIAAVSELEKQVPAIRDYFWMLPASYRGQALVQTYRFGRWLRKLWGCPACDR